LLAASSFAADEAAQLALGKKLFSKAAVPAWAMCHTLKDAASEAAVVPVLDATSSPTPTAWQPH